MEFLKSYEFVMLVVALGVVGLVYAFYLFSKLNKIKVENAKMAEIRVFDTSLTIK